MNAQKREPEITINPQQVTLARQVRALTQAQLAKRAGTRQDVISKIEAGVQPLSKPELEKLSRALDFPHHFFFWHKTINGPPVPEFIHRRRAKASASALHRLHAVATLRQMHIEILFNSYEAETSVPSYPIDEFEANPKRIAQTVRAMWEVPPGPVFNVTDLVERAGAVVVGFDFGTRDIDGFSRRLNNGPPVIFINDELPPDRWRWTIVHELAHLVMHGESDPYPEIENDADLFAGEFLMPSQEISRQLTRVTLDRLAGLKRYWKVSMQAIMMKAHDLRMITTNQKRYLFMQLSRAGYRLQEPPVLDPPVEPPCLLRRVVEHHRRNLRYSDSDLCDALAINVTDLHAWYGSEKPKLFALK